MIDRDVFEKTESVWYKTKLISQFLTLSFLIAQPFNQTYLLAAPAGGNVVGGSGDISTSNLTTTINQNTQNLAIDWQSFDVKSNEHVHFVQPNSSSIALNRILGNNGSTIQGRIYANGQVILVNPNGVFFTSTAVVNVGGLIASSLDMTPANFMNGNYIFNEVVGSDGQVINSGLINASLGDLGVGGNVALIGKQVKNDGLISASLGSVVLAAGKQSILTFDNNGLIGVSVTKEVLQQELGLEEAVINNGNIKATGGRVLLTASTSQDVFTSAVNNGALDAASSVVVNDDGSFTLGGGADVLNTGSIDVSSDSNSQNSQRIILLGENVTSSGSIIADTQNGVAGEIELHAKNATLLTENSVTSAQALLSGTGGLIKVLGDKVGLSDFSSINASGVNGGGEVLFGGDRRGLNASIRNADFIYLGENTNIFADATGMGNGGKIITFAKDTSRIYGDLFSRGGVIAGNGGFIETSGLRGFEITNTPDVTAQIGNAGEWLIDPYNITIISGSGSSNITPSGGNPATSFISNGDTAQLGVQLIQNGLSDGVTVTIATTEPTLGSDNGNIIFDADSNLDFNGSGNATLTLIAHNDIIFESNRQIGDSSPNDGDQLNLNLFAKGVVNLKSGAVINTQGGNFTVGDGGSYTPTNFTNSGTIDTTGADDVNGGAISIYANSITSSGDLLAEGGAAQVTGSTGHIGLNGGEIKLISSGLITVSGDIKANGSDGKYDNSDREGRNGGIGGAVTIESTANNIVITGRVESKGGNADGDNQTGSAGDPASGGNGGNIIIKALTGSVAVDRVRTNGGDAIGARDGQDTGLTPTGGNAGSISITSNSSGITLNNDIKAKGGKRGGNNDDFGTSGNGNNIIFTGPVTLTDANGNQEIKIDASGGTADVVAFYGVGGNVTFTGTVTTSEADRVEALTVLAKQVTFGAAVGSTNTHLGDITITATDAVNAASNNIYANLLNVIQSSSFSSGLIDTSSIINTTVNGGNVTINSDTLINISSIDSRGGNRTDNGDGRIGGNVQLSSESIIVGGINTTGGNGFSGNRNGGNAGTITLTANEGAGAPSVILNGDINATGGLKVASGNGNNGLTRTAAINLVSGTTSLITINHATDFTTPVNVTASAGSTDTITSAIRQNVWNVTNVGVGTLNSNLTFNSFEILNGNSEIDTFMLSGDITNKINGLGNNDIFNIGTTITGAIDGGAGTDTLNAENVNNYWNITADNTATIYTNSSMGTQRVNFSDIEALNGNAAIDEFNLAFDVTNQINGLGGNDIFNILTSVSGAMDGGVNNDTFNISSDFTGTLTAGSGNDTFNIVLTGLTLSQQLNGGAGTDELIAANELNVWDITAFNQGVIYAESAKITQRSSFTSIETLTGNANIDQFDLAFDITNQVNGAGGNDIYNITSSVSVAMNGGAGADIFNINSDFTGSANGDAGNDVFEINISVTSGGTLNGGADLDTFNINAINLTVVSINGGTEVDTLNAANEDNYWLIEGQGDGRIFATDPGTVGPYPTNQRVTFIDVETLNGGSSDDVFIYTLDPSSLIATTVNGGTQTVSDIVRLADNLTGVTLVAGSLTNIERYIGNANKNTLQGASNTTNDWQIYDLDGALALVYDGINDGSINGIIFEDFSMLKGGAVNSIDEFTFTGTAYIEGDVANSIVSIDGNLGTSNRIYGPDEINNWQVDGTGSGSLNINTTFENIQFIDGGTANDTFTFNTVASLTGITIDGGISGNNTVALGSFVSGATLVAGSFTNINRYIGNTNLTNTLQGVSGSGTTNTWSIEDFDSAGTAADGINDGKIITGGNITEFINFALLKGGAGGSTDNFTFVSTASLTGTTGINGFGGTDTITGADYPVVNNWLITSSKAGSINGNTFIDIDVLNGTDSNDSFTFNLDPSASGIAINGFGEQSGGQDQVVLATGLTNVTLIAGSFNNIERYVGNSSLTNTLQGVSGSGTTNTWSIEDFDSAGTAADGINDGKIITGGNTTEFINFALLKGGAGGSSDNFTFVGAASVMGTTGIDGFGGTDTITGPAGIINTWLINGNNSGSLNGSTFTDIDTLNGSELRDTFQISASYIGDINGLNGNDIFNISGNISGSMDGGANNDTFNINSSFTGSITGGANNDTFKILTTGLTLNQTLNGGADTDTLIAANEVNYWTIGGLDAGIIYTNSNQNTQRSNFSNIENITGGAFSDTFDLSNLGATISGLIRGGSNTGISTYNTIIAHNEENNWNITNLDRGALATRATTAQYANFSAIQNFTGSSSANDYITFSSLGNVSGLIDGRGDTTGDQLDLSAIGSVSVEVGIAINANININNIENVQANSSSNNTLYSRAGANTWSIENTGATVFVSDGVDDGILNGSVTFVNFRNLTGTNNAVDDFTIVDGSRITGALNGGSVTGPADYNTLTGQNVASDWTITNLDRGYVSYAGTSTRYVNNFINIQTLNGGASADNFRLSSNTAAITDEIYGGVTNLLDSTTFNTIAGFDQTNTWTLTAANQGDINSSSNFRNIQNLMGAATADDTFKFNIGSSLAGLIDGRGNTATGDSINLTALQNNILLTAGEDFINIEKIDAGNGFVNTLVGATGTNTWSINNADEGTLNSSLSFLGFANLVGNDSAIIPSIDNFTFTINGQLSGYIDGAGGASDTLNVVALNAVDVFISNVNSGLNADYVFAVNVETINASTNSAFVKRIIGGNVNNTWIIDGVDTGTINVTGNNAADQKTRFNNFNNILGGYRDDRFQITGSISGTIDANETNNATPDNDQIDFSLQTTEKTISLADGSPFGSVINIEGIIGNGINMTLEGDNTPNTWDITGINSGIINDGTPERITFSGFNYLRGNDQVDIFNVTVNPLDLTENGTIGTINGNIIEGEIFGAGGDDILNITLTGRESGQIRFDGGGQNDQVNISSGTLISGSYTGSYTPNVDYTFKSVTNSYDQLSYTHTSLKNFVVDYRNVNSVQDGVVADSFTINGTAGTDSIDLAANSFKVNANLAVGFSYADKTSLVIDALSSGANTINVSANIGTSLTNISFANAVMASDTNVITANSLSFDNASAGIDETQRMLTDMASLNIANSQAIYLSDSSANLDIAQLNTNGIVDVYLATGNITNSSDLVSDASFLANAASGNISLLGNNMLSSEVSLLAANGTVVFENNIDTVLANVTTTDFTLNIFNSNNVTQSVASIITANNITLDSSGAFTLGNANQLNNITVSNSNNVTINNVNSSNIINVNVANDAELYSNGVRLGYIKANKVTIDSGNSNIVDTNGSILNIEANNIILLASNGIGTVDDKIETQSNGEISATNINGGDIAISNIGDLTLRDVSNLDGDIAIDNIGDLSIDSLETITDFTDAGTGRIDINVTNGSVYGEDKVNYAQQSDVRANSISFLLDGNNSIGTGERPLSVEVPETVEVLLSRQTFIYFYGTEPLNFIGENELSNQIFDLINNLAGQQLIEVESLAQIDPAIFTDVRNYSHSDTALMMPADQRYDELEKDKEKSHRLN